MKLPPGLFVVCLARRVKDSGLDPAHATQFNTSSPCLPLGGGYGHTLFEVQITMQFNFSSTF